MRRLVRRMKYRFKTVPTSVSPTTAREAVLNIMSKTST